jgi:hypothetical protein
MLDVEALRGRRGASSGSRTLLVNLGGFANPFLDYATRGSYVDIVLRWLTARAETSRDFDTIVVCSGAFAESYEKVVNGARIRVGLLRHAELLGLLSTRPVYLAAPGLTSLHEAIMLGVPVMLLPDQHYGHTHNRRSLAGTRLTRYATTFTDLGLATDIPDSDLDGTLALAEVAAAIERDPGLFRSFAGYMNGRLDRFRTMAPADSDRFVGELAELLNGTPITGIMSGIREEMRDAMAGLSS